MTIRAVRNTMFLLVWCVTWTASVLPGLAQSTTKPVSKVTLSDLSFISGRGTGDLGGGVIDEQWSLPAGDSMMGMFRYVKDGKAVFYEFLLIEQTQDGPVLRLKHFNPGLIGREEKAEVYSYPLVEYNENRAVFERPDKLTRLTFHRKSADSLSVVLDQTRDGKLTSTEFVYKRVP
ncbi:MAG TPA: DUF6265 family protein [Blastocatellia bacterium]|nr:DUF6265 family protein [Blastocatellia bacterium]